MVNLFNILVICLTAVLWGIDAQEWTIWIDHDNPSGRGDWECAWCFSQLPKGIVCGNRQAIGAQCRQLETGLVFNSSTVNLMPNIFLYNCTPEEGLVCVNEDNLAIGRPYCEDYAIRFLCPRNEVATSPPYQTTPPMTSHDTKTSAPLYKTEWSEWLDRDDPSGRGDWECVNCFIEDGKSICGSRKAIGAQCRQLHTGIIFNSTTVHRMPNIFRYNCTPEGGLVCVNSDNYAIGRPYCKDYEIRFLCPRNENATSPPYQTTPPMTWHASNHTLPLYKTEWSKWFDRDDPSGNGDYECIRCYPKDRRSICDGKKPIRAQCRQLRTGALFDSSTVYRMPNIFRYNCTSEEGIACINRDNYAAGRPFCNDYAIRFLCTTNVSTTYTTHQKTKQTTWSDTQTSAVPYETEWSRWFDRDNPLGKGDYECLRCYPKDRHSICDGRQPIRAQCRQLRTGVLFDSSTVHRMPNIFRYNCTPEEGITCVNRDNFVVGRPLCNDYAIRFLCSRDVSTTFTTPQNTGEITWSNTQTSAVPHETEWSRWFDRDNPSGNGDYECLHCYPKDRNSICEGRKPIGAQCRQLRTGVLFNSSTVYRMPNIFLYNCTPEAGLACVNKDNYAVGRPFCEDYAIRFVCTKNTTSTSTISPNNKRKLIRRPAFGQKHRFPTFTVVVVVVVYILVVALLAATVGIYFRRIRNRKNQKTLPIEVFHIDTNIPTSDKHALITDSRETKEKSDK